MTPLVLVGGGGHCRAAIDVVLSTGSYEIAGIVERPESGLTSVLGFKVIGHDPDLERLVGLFQSALVTVGQITDPEPRARLYEVARQFGTHFPVVVSPYAYVSPRAELGPGTIVMHGSIVNCLARVGANCIVNSMALLEHDCTVGDHTHIATGVRLNGGVSIGSRTFVGSGAIVREGVAIGDDCVISAGAVVMRDVPTGQMVRRVP